MAGVIPPAPEFPQAARYAGQEGFVQTELKIGSDGKVKSVKIVKNVGSPAFKGAARKAAYGCRFAPPMFQGKRVSTLRKRTFEFRLRH